MHKHPANPLSVYNPPQQHLPCLNSSDSQGSPGARHHHKAIPQHATTTTPPIGASHSKLKLGLNCPLICYPYGPWAVAASCNMHASHRYTKPQKKNRRERTTALRQRCMAASASTRLPGPPKLNGLHICTSKGSHSKAAAWCTQVGHKFGLTATGTNSEIPTAQRNHA